MELIKRFGESVEAPLQQWYETSNGKRVECNEKMIDKLWIQWVNDVNSTRKDTDEFAVYEFHSPISPR